MNGLKLRCERSLAKNICTDNAVKLFSAAVLISGVNFTNILGAAFMLVDPGRIQVWLSWITIEMHVFFDIKTTKYSFISATFLLRKSFEFLKQNLDSLVGTRDWKEMVVSNPEAVRALFND